jgi:hypothetical protein
MAKQVLETFRSIVGAVAGGILGYAAFFWVARHGFYALALPGIVLGLGCSVLSQGRSALRGAVCALVAFPLGVYTDWRFDNPPNQHTLGYWFSHLPQQGIITLILLAVGTLAAYWFGADGMFQAWWPWSRKPAYDSRGRVEA